MSASRAVDRVPLALRIAAIAFAVFSILWILGRGVAPFDEPLQLVDALLVRQGARPHVDFWTAYPALNYYLIAGAYAILGPTVVAERLLFVIAYVGLVIAVLVVMRDRQATPRAAAAYALVVTMIFSINLPWPTTAVYGFVVGAVLAYVVALRHTGRERLLWTLGAGVLAALALVTKINFGLYAALAIGLDIVLATFASGTDRESPGSAAGLLAALIVPIILAVALYALAYRDDLGLLIAQLWTIPQHLPLPIRPFVLRGSPWRALAGLISSAFIVVPLIWMMPRVARGVRLALLALTILVLGGVLALQGSHPTMLILLVVPVLAGVVVVQWIERPLSRGEFTTLVAMTAFVHYFLYRADIPHVAMLVPFVTLLLPPAMRASPAAARVAVAVTAFALWLPVTAAAAMARHPTAIVAGLRLLAPGRLASRQSDADRLAHEPVPLRGADAELYPDTNTIEAVQFLVARSGPRDPIFVGLADSSRTPLGNVLAYWLAGRPIGTRYDWLQSGFSTRDTIQREIIADLEARDVRWAILWDGPHGDVDPDFDPSATPRSHRLDAYLNDHFSKMARFGAFAVYARR